MSVRTPLPRRRPAVAAASTLASALTLATAFVVIWQPSSGAAAGECPQTREPIETDRPDTTNSSSVVPVGSLQNENGLNVSRKGGATVFDGSNSRWRLGVAPCLEVLVDLPDYTTPLRRAGPSGWGDIVPAVKWQISPVPGTLDLSATFGAGLPSGARSIAGRGVQPYLEFPWSLQLADGWSITGMETNFFTPDDPLNRFTNQSTFVLERAFSERAFLFVEYVGDFPIAGGASHLINTGGGYRITDTQQIDFHIGFGLNRNAPAYVFGLGYSFRLDGLFGQRP